VESKEEMRDWGLPSSDRADALALALAADVVAPGEPLLGYALQFIS
jgi:hypothetical protein